MKTKGRKILALLMSFVMIFGAIGSTAVMSSAYSPIVKDEDDNGADEAGTDIYAYYVSDYDEDTREITMKFFICGVTGHSKIDFNFAITELDYLDWTAPKDGYNHNVTVYDDEYELTVDGDFREDVVLAAEIRFYASEEVYDWEVMTLTPSYVDGNILINTDYTGEYYKTGDVNGDGKITPADARLMLDYNLGLEFPSLPSLSAAIIDETTDSDITTAEIRSVLRFAARLDATLGKSVTDVPSGYDSDNLPECSIESEYDEQRGTLSVRVSADNIKNHHSARISLDIPDSFTWGYYEAVDSKYINSVGISLLDGKFAMGTVAMEAFNEDTVPIADFEFLVDKDKYSSLDTITASLVYDDSDYEISRTFSDFGIGSSGGDTENIVMGDVDSDGNVTAADAKEMMKFALGLELPTKDQMTKGDIDRDGKISLTEVRSVLRFAAHLTSVIEITDDVLPGAKTPSISAQSRYDSETSILTVRFFADDMDGHTSVQAVFGKIDGLEFVSASRFNGSYSNEAGIRSDNSSFAMGAVAMENFGESSVELGTFEFKVNKDKLTASSANFDIDLTFDNFPSVKSTVKIDCLPGCDLPPDIDNPDNPNDPDDEIRDNFLYPCFYYDEDQECAVFNIQLCNFDNVSAFPNGKITLNYPSDMLKYTGFEPGSTEGVKVSVSETSAGVLTVDYTADSDVPATDNMLVDLMFKIIPGSGFAYAEIKSVSPTYMTDREGNKIDYSLSEKTAICTHKNTVSLADKEPTCTSAGSKGGQKCVMCGETFDSTYIAPLGHNYDAGKCTVCGKYTTDFNVNFEGSYIRESGVVDVNISLPNDDQFWKYEMTIEYPGSSLIYMDRNYYINGEKLSRPGKYDFSYYTEEINGKTYIIIKVQTNDYSYITDDIYFNFKFYAPSKSAQTLTFKTDSSDIKYKNWAFMGIDMIENIPESSFTVTTDPIPSESSSKLNCDTDVTADENKKTASIQPKETSGITAAEFKSHFVSNITMNCADDKILVTGDKFTFAGVTYTIIIKGDLNSDGKVTAADARTILRIAAKLENPDDITKSAADINSDGSVITSEARDVLRFSAKLSPVIWHYIPGK